ncbi:MAG: sulfonate ABC transporter [Desulfurococcales archaeon]|nr:sulfonate ABC transporter [Desulfurococcales archaeon]
MARCPVCGLEVRLGDDYMPGELIEHDCGAVLEVVKGPSGLGVRLFEGSMEDWGE